MPTAVIINDEDEAFHFSHPDKDSETFCGEPYSQETAARVASFAHYVDFVSATIASEEDKEECPECSQKITEY